MVKANRAQTFYQQHVLNKLPGWRAKGRLLFKAPIGLAFIGVEMETSRWDTDDIPAFKFWFRSTYLHDERYLGVPHRLFIDRPERLGWRLVSGEEELMAADLLRAVTPLIARVEPVLETPRTIVECFAQVGDELTASETWTLEMIACNHIICGSANAAIAKLERVIEDWQARNESSLFNVTINEFMRLRDACRSSLPSAMAVLHEWDVNFLAFHRLEQFADPNRWNAVRD